MELNLKPPVTLLIKLRQFYITGRKEKGEEKERQGVSAGADRPETQHTPTPTGETNWANDLPTPSSRPRAGRMPQDRHRTVYFAHLTSDQISQMTY